MTGTLRHKSPTVKSYFEGYTLEMGINWRKVLSDNLKELRGDRSQQAAVGKKMLVRTYSRLEALETDATLSSIVAAAEAYGVAPWQLLRAETAVAEEGLAASLPAFAQAYIQGEIEQIKAALEGMPGCLCGTWLRQKTQQSTRRGRTESGSGCGKTSRPALSRKNLPFWAVGKEQR